MNRLGGHNGACKLNVDNFMKGPGTLGVQRALVEAVRVSGALGHATPEMEFWSKSTVPCLTMAQLAGAGAGDDAVPA